MIPKPTHILQLPDNYQASILTSDVQIKGKNKFQKNLYMADLNI